MLGLDFAPANSALGGSESGACSWGTVTQTEQNRESSASSFFYGNGGTKFRKSEIFYGAAVVLLVLIAISAPVVCRGEHAEPTGD